jgi:3-deoxy-D-manno-octulosonic-acid transferase
MPSLWDVLYLLAAPFLLGYLAISRLRGHPARQDLSARLGRGPSLKPAKRRILLHAVSVGEVNAIRGLVTQLVDGEADIVISVTTDTGMARAQSLFADSCTVVRFPVDLSCAVRRFLDRINPQVMVLVELEVWPNLIAACCKREIPVVVVNGRLSERSFLRYRLVAGLLRRVFGRIHSVGVQEAVYAERLATLGVPRERMFVYGTMKWDNAVIRDDAAGADALASDMGIDRSMPLIVAGSTAPGEHELLRSSLPDGVQLLCGPRKPEWFDQAASVLAGCTRRSSGRRGDSRLFLLDSIGELTAAYALADVVVIGRSFVNMHGSDPADSIALGKATVIGPHVSDFQDMVAALVAGGGLEQCDAEGLPGILAALLADPGKRSSLATSGRSVIRNHQGATHRYAGMVAEAMADA